MILLDTWTWIEVFRGTKLGEKAIEIITKEPIVYTSMISIAEIAQWAKRNNLDSDTILNRLDGKTSFIEVNYEILKRSGERHAELRQTQKTIGMIDSIVYTSALIHGMTVLTGDSDFEGLPCVEILK